MQQLQKRTKERERDRAIVTSSAAATITYEMI